MHMPQAGREEPSHEPPRFPANCNQRRTAMPVIVLWAIPAVIILGGGAYWIAHLH
jgi:hypothetical protein